MEEVTERGVIRVPSDAKSPNENRRPGESDGGPGQT